MFVSFLQGGLCFYWIDYSEHPSLIHQEFIEDFSPEFYEAILEKNNNNYKIKIIKKPIIESFQEKRNRVYQKLRELPELNATTDTAILEGVQFTDKEKGDLIVDRVFEGNPHAQTAMFANLLSGRKDPDFMLWVAQSQQLTSHILEFFKMDGIGEKEREEAKERTKKEVEMMKLTPAKKSSNS